MKKTALVTIVILALLISMLPMSMASAKAYAPVITVRNQTGSAVTLVVQNAKMNKHYTFADNVTKFQIPAGTYSYVAQTACGNKYGTLNMSRTAILHFSCVKTEMVKIAPVGR